MQSVWKTIGVISFCVLLTLPTLAQANLVEDVEIRGYKKVSLEKIKRQIRTKAGKKLDEKMARQDFARLMKTGAFDPLKSKLSIDDGPRGGKIVIFELREKP